MITYDNTQRLCNADMGSFEEKEREAVDAFLGIVADSQVIGAQY